MSDYFRQWMEENIAQAAREEKNKEPNIHGEANDFVDAAMKKKAQQRADWIRRNTFDQSGKPYQPSIVKAIKNEDGTYTIPI